MCYKWSFTAACQPMDHSWCLCFCHTWCPCPSTAMSSQKARHHWPTEPTPARMAPYLHTANRRAQLILECVIVRRFKSCWYLINPPTHSSCLPILGRQNEYQQKPGSRQAYHIKNRPCTLQRQQLISTHTGQSISTSRNTQLNDHLR